MRTFLAVLSAFALLSAGCAIGEKRDRFNDERGRGDSPVGAVDDTPKEIIQFPDRFMNVAHACDGHGHRVFVTTRPENGRYVAVIDDPSCGGTR